MSTPPSWAAPDGWAPEPEQPPATGDRPTSAAEPSIAQPSTAQPATGQPSAAAPPSAPPSAGWQAAPGWGGPAAGGWGGPAAGGGGTAAGWGAPRPPDVRPGIVPLRPLGLGEVLDGAVGVVRRYPRPTLGLSAALALLTALLNIPLLLRASDSPFLDGSAFEPGNTVELDGALGGLAAGFGVSALLSFLSGVVLAGVITAVVGKGVLGQPMSLREAWDAVRPQLGRLLGLALVVLVIVYGVFLLAVFAGVAVTVATGGIGALVGVPLALLGIVFAVYAYVRLSLAPSALVLEKAGLRQSLRRSGVLVKGDWLRVFGILLLTLVITLFVSSVLQAPFQVRSFLGGFSGEPQGLTTTDVLLQSIGSTLAVTLVAPFEAAVRALLYVDRRMRAEGLDVSLAASAAGSPPA